VSVELQIGLFEGLSGLLMLTLLGLFSRRRHPAANRVTLRDPLGTTIAVRCTACGSVKECW
jgi:hypothetical protein